jgi:serine/threonine protein kinase
LSKDRDIIITDFGFANRFQVANRDLMATSCGSPCYAAPELVINDENTNYVGTAVDIWSCGVILFAMLCGYLPFDDDPTNPQGASINVLYKYIVSTPLEIPKTLSIDATHLLRRMLVPDPTKRCTMDEIRRHPWLSDHRELLNLSMEELESHIDYSDPYPVHQVRQARDMPPPPLAAPTLLEEELEQDNILSICNAMPAITMEQEEEDCVLEHHDCILEQEEPDDCILEQEPVDYVLEEKEEQKESTETEKPSIPTPELSPTSPASPIIEPKQDEVQERISPVNSINNVPSTPRPTSFLQAKFFSTLQRRVSTNTPDPTRYSMQPRANSDNNNNNNKIPNRSQSVQPQKPRRDRTTSEYYTNNNNPRKSLHVLPSVSEQTTVTDQTNSSKTRSKGQKLMDWFKRKPSSQSKFLTFYCTIH